MDNYEGRYENMNLKIVGLLVGMLLIALLFPLSGAAGIEEDEVDNSITIINGHIKLDGTFVNAFHFKYRKALSKDNYSLRMSIIKFIDAEISVNDNEWIAYGSGRLFIYRYNGLYDHNNDNNNLSMNGKARFLYIDMQ